MNLSTGRAESHSFGQDHVLNFENVSTGESTDIIIGSATTNTIDAGAGEDLIDARGGQNVVTGGTGNDVFYVRGADIILDQLTDSDFVNSNELNGTVSKLVKITDFKPGDSITLFDKDVYATYSTIAGYTTEFIVGTGTNEDTYMTGNSNVSLSSATSTTSYKSIGIRLSKSDGTNNYSSKPFLITNTDHAFSASDVSIVDYHLDSLYNTLSDVDAIL